MTLLIISPDYASHLLPLASLGAAWQQAGERVVVATGPATADIVASFGYEREHLQLGRGSNPGVIRAENQVDEEADSLRGFFDATRRGMVPTLRYQAQERLVDLMWQPVQSAQATLEVVDRVQPDAIIVDHLAYSARLGLWAAGIDYGDVVLGHPTALPVGGEVYGYPPDWPAAFSPDTGELADLDALCRRVASGFTAEWNLAARRLGVGGRTVEDAFALHGPLVLYNYPAGLADPRREGELPAHRYLGGALRPEPADAEVDAWLESDEPFVYVSFGSFLSVRDDVLARVAEALRTLGVRAAIASGSTPIEALGPTPSGWLVRAYLPQVRLLRGAALAVTHGGNNSVTEAVGTATPMLVLPFSTDQFAGAAAIERAGFGEALAPNSATVDELRAAIERVLARGEQGIPDLVEAARELDQDPGATRAFRALTESASS
ncbi:glycosyltransferase [Amnibacterium flavum]|uniref:Glycosyltransferase n=1 Tax=Amnibacterium flavum TaxID=2173173 RepID=A0A2V1HLA3_9MICO|nr:glycosyltransferase [Amnibacterium flavum]PVZ93426.1 glycosyltransferase [Amnibacterium flavum]